MTSRSVIVLGTSSQVPTRTRAQNGYAIQWDDTLLLFDPGEGFHRQSLLAGIAISRAAALFISHFHGDHCLGVPGIIHRRLLERPDESLAVYYPAAGQDTFEMLTHASVASTPEVLDPRPIAGEGPVGHIERTDRRSEDPSPQHPRLDIVVRRLEHHVPTFGYRLVESATDVIDADALAAAGVTGRDLGELQRRGELQTPVGRLVLDDVMRRRRGQVVAYVMDSAPCEAAVDLARDADLMICEATFLDRDRDLARESGHMTALDAASIAREAGVRRLVLSHFSSRYHDLEAFAEEAGTAHDDVVIARDLERIPFPATRSRTNGRRR